MVFLFKLIVNLLLLTYLLKSILDEKYTYASSLLYFI